MPALIRINGKPDEGWRINMMPAGDGSFRLYLSGQVRKSSGTGVGDRVNVEISFDAGYKGGPMHPLPSWFRTALANDPIARKNWDALSPSRRKEILRYFSWLKTPETRNRNLARALHVLSGKSGRFMARTWTGGK
jgi:hypothetical protein